MPNPSLHQRNRVFINPLILDLVPASLARRREDVALLRASGAAFDFTTIGRIGHKLCGNGALFGFVQISQIGSGIESAALRSDLLEVMRLTAHLDEYLESLDFSADEEL